MCLKLNFYVSIQTKSSGVAFGPPAAGAPPPALEPPRRCQDTTQGVRRAFISINDWSDTQRERYITLLRTDIYQLEPCLSLSVCFQECFDDDIIFGCFHVESVSMSEDKYDENRNWFMVESVDTTGSSEEQTGRLLILQYNLINYLQWCDTTDY